MSESGDFGTIPMDRPLDPNSAAGGHDAGQLNATPIEPVLPEPWDPARVGTTSEGIFQIFKSDLGMAPLPSGRGYVSAAVVAEPPAEQIESPTAMWSSRYIPLQKIGPGLPLSIEILSMFPGDARRQGPGRGQRSLLVTSAVKDPAEFGGAPLAMNYYFPQVTPGTLLHPGPDQSGSSVVYYSPGVVSDSLQIQLSMYFDTGNKEKTAKWADAAKKAAGLPVFAVLPQAEVAGAIVYAAGAALQFANSLFDDLFRGPPPWKASWTLNMNEPGLRAQAAYMLFYEDGCSNVVPGRPGLPGGELDFRMRDRQYVISIDDGTLRYRDAPDQTVLDGGPYIIVRLHGAEREGLSQWAPVAVSTALYQRFISAKGEAGGDRNLLEVLKAYNDMVMVKKAMAIAQSLPSPIPSPFHGRPGTPVFAVLSPYEDKQRKLQGALNNIQDRDLRELVRKAIA